MSYSVDKAIFVRHYKRKNPVDAEAEAAWRIYFIARRAELYAERVEAAGRHYDEEEARLGASPKNLDRRELPGGMPFERVVESLVHYPEGRSPVASVLLEDKRSRQVIEVTSITLGKIYRLSASAPLLHQALRSVPARLGFSELEAVTLWVAEDGERFERLAALDKGVDALAQAPDAALLERWGEAGARAIKQL